MIRPRKSLGQHFLRDENIVRKILETVQPAAGETILEIGPGQGALTRHLAAAPIHLVAVEVDERAVQILHEQLPPTVTLMQGSILDVQLSELSRYPAAAVRVIGNIPYNLTHDILFWLFDQRTTVRDATLMVQLEVAQRLSAAPRTKAYGILSVFTQFYTQCHLLFKVARTCFFPRPEVDSAVIQMTFRPSLPEVNEPLFREVVRATFGKRRKTLRNGLKSMGLGDVVLNRLNVNLLRRPEELTVDEFVQLSHLVETIRKETTRVPGQ